MEILNIIESENGTISNVTSFVISKNNKEKQVETANKLATLLVHKLDLFITPEDIEDFLDNGYYLSNSSNNEVSIVWSSAVDFNDLYPVKNILYYTVSYSFQDNGDCEEKDGNKTITVYIIKNGEPKIFCEIESFNHLNSETEIQTYLDNNDYSEEFEFTML
jgi:hypothetical protein